MPKSVKLKMLQQVLNLAYGSILFFPMSRNEKAEKVMGRLKTMCRQHQAITNAYLQCFLGLGLGLVFYLILCSGFLLIINQQCYVCCQALH